MIGPRLRPELRKRELVPPAEFEFRRLRAHGCKWTEYVKPMARSRVEEARYREWSARWDDPAT